MSIGVFGLNISFKIENYKCVEFMVLGVGSYYGFWPNKS
jgi:hypothetical protein